jgi:CubicO group peptidase (beta-lactamase class C family)
MEVMTPRAGVHSGGEKQTRRSFVAGLSAALLHSRTKATCSSGHGAFDAVGQRIADAVTAGKATGVAVAVTHKGKIVWEQGLGWADQDVGRRVTSHTPFCLASITKPFTTTLLASLAAEGRIGLDQAIGEFLEGLPSPGPNGNPSGATIRRLGAHAGGMPTIFEMYWPDRGPKPAPTATLLHEYNSLAFPPGAVYEYSNIGYAMIGAVASKLTGQEFGSLMTNRILEPLALVDSFFGTDRVRLADRALQYEAAGDVLPYYTTATPASGELFVSAHDLARFAIFNLNGILGRTCTLLDNKWLSELHKPVLSGPAGTATTFGWFRAQTKAGLNVIFKDGGQPGVSTMVYLVPSHDLSCVVLTNRSDNYGFAIGIVDEILGSFIPGWDTPEARPDGPSSPFIARNGFRGRWEGELSGGGAKMQSALEIASDHDATFSLDGGPPERIFNLLSRQGGLVGNTVGKITAAEAVRTQGTNLALKLIRYESRLVGRVLATAEKPGTTLPYVLSLVQVSKN